MGNDTRYTPSPVVSPDALPTHIVRCLPQPLALFDATGRILVANDAWDASRLRQVVGLHDDFLAALERAGDREAPLRQLATKIRSVIAGETRASQFDLAAQVNGQPSQVLVRITAVDGVPGHAMVTQEDITSLTASKRAVAESERLLRMVLRSLPVGVTVFTGDGHIVMSNPAAKALTGGFRLDSTGGRLLDLQGRAIPEPERPIARTLATGAPLLDEVLQVELPGRTNRVVSYSALPISNGPGRSRGAIAVQLDITERTLAEQKVRESEHRMHALLTSVNDGIIGLDANDVAVFCNPAAEGLLQLTKDRVVGSPLSALIGEAAVATTAVAGALHEATLTRPGSAPTVVEIDLTTATHAEHRDVAKVLTIRDITQRRNLQAQLSQAQKLEGIGQLAAGIAHEINTPTQYIGDNLRFLNDSLQPIAAALDELHQATTAGSASAPDSLARAAELMRAVDWGFLRTEIPRAFADSLDGVERVARIVTSMKEFSHPDSTEKQTVDVNRVVSSAVNVCRHEWRQVAEVALELDPALPGVPGFAGDLGQVVLNLVVNAAHAIGERGERGGLGRIEVKTRPADGGVLVAVSDDGNGIPDHVKPRIFEQFFTTKSVGKGTGQGLSLVHRIVVNRHGGKVWFESCVGKGTTFFLQLPP